MFKDLLITTRFGNLLIIGILQYLGSQLFWDAPGKDIVWVIVATVAIAYAGYIINDFYDQEIDKKNRPGKNLFEKSFYKKHGLKVYVLLNIVGIGIATIFSIRMLILHILCVALLYVYAAFFKGKPFIGNLLVAGMQAAVLLSLWFAVDSRGQSAERLLSNAGSEATHFFFSLMMGFSFLTGWIREWIKDMEDREGDGDAQLRTAALILSEKTNRYLIAFLCLALSIGIGAFTLSLHLNVWTGFRDVLNYYYLFLMFPICVRAFLMVLRAKERADWSKLSQWLKIIMLAGVLSLGIV